MSSSSVSNTLSIETKSDPKDPAFVASQESTECNEHDTTQLSGSSSEPLENNSSLTRSTDDPSVEIRSKLVSPDNEANLLSDQNITISNENNNENDTTEEAETSSGNEAADDEDSSSDAQSSVPSFSEIHDGMSEEELDKERKTLTHLRRISLQGADDPEIPTDWSVAMSPPETEQDASTLFWVPANLHPELNPTGWKSFLDLQVKNLKSPTATDTSSSPLEHIRSLRRRKSLLSRQVKADDAVINYQDGSPIVEKAYLKRHRSLRLNELEHLESLARDPHRMVSLVDGMSNGSPEDSPLLVSPNHFLQRSSRTTIRRTGASIRTIHRGKTSTLSGNRSHSILQKPTDTSPLHKIEPISADELVESDDSRTSALSNSQNPSDDVENQSDQALEVLSLTNPPKIDNASADTTLHKETNKIDKLYVSENKAESAVASESSLSEGTLALKAPAPENKPEKSSTSKPPVPENKAEDSVVLKSSVPEDKSENSIASKPSATEGIPENAIALQSSVPENKAEDSVVLKSSVPEDKSEDSVPSKSSVLEDKHENSVEIDKKADDSLPSNNKTEGYTPSVVREEKNYSEPNASPSVIPPRVPTPVPGRTLSPKPTRIPTPIPSSLNVSLESSKKPEIFHERHIPTPETGPNKPSKNNILKSTQVPVTPKQKSSTANKGSTSSPSPPSSESKKTKRSWGRLFVSGDSDKEHKEHKKDKQKKKNDQISSSSKSASSFKKDRDKESIFGSLFGSKKKQTEIPPVSSSPPHNDAPPKAKPISAPSELPNTTSVAEAKCQTVTDDEGTDQQSDEKSTEPKTFIPDKDYYWSRFPICTERAIYRLSHIKLSNAHRPLFQQVLLSNFMYSYLDLISRISSNRPMNNVQQSTAKPIRKDINGQQRRSEFSAENVKNELENLSYQFGDQRKRNLNRKGSTIHTVSQNIQKVSKNAK
ncbi:Protein zds1 [Schizosaccharomyces pombe]|uniref:Protein zds1 n=1 Tax=Schizosaccharomyces pombe (strain 972 / ATCC 24843) TaxID=284812 RepID=ZDS1_SCHPO|nr:putative zds family phosphatase type A regulator Zds1 [Schizosaccharomyces pombe]O14100.2 RecName: Full=Protein zds1; AltName: Full=Meiotically up-regulated gene 88 protein [Schizosaccharomyces pombe 972h-]CAA22593.1 zds family protein phosphatase type A regulator Zds1 (predicted) [Schizosaccharomyces pombe]|eukprot:NP_594632.1 putative zds family phosphatase type A regulator Zds1 [Schizosaccharomyces pombe]